MQDYINELGLLNNEFFTPISNDKLNKYDMLMDWNCSIPGCEAAAVAISITPIENVGGGQWVQSGSIDELRTYIIEEFPLAIDEFEAFVESIL